MSNDNQQLANLVGDGSQMPAFVRNGAGAELNKEAKAGTGGESINRISLKQSRFRLIVGGEQVKVFDEPYMDVVIVRTNPNISKAYYARKYDPNADDQSPDCYSSNGVVPDPDVNNKQCDSCANCPMNEWGSKISDISGKKVKACSDIKRIAIVPAANVEAPMFQVSIPAGSLKVFGSYVRMLDQVSPPIPYNGVITRLKFDPESDTPKLQFEPKGWVSDDQYAILRERYKSDEAKHVTTTVDAPVDRDATDTNGGTTAAQPQAEAQRKAEEEAKQKAAEEQRKAEEAAALKAKQEEAAALKAKQEEQKKAEEEAAAKAKQTAAAAAWDATPDPKADEKPATSGAEDAFAASGWDSAPKAAQKASEPPPQEHVEESARVVENDESIDAIFGAGFDDQQ